MEAVWLVAEPDPVTPMSMSSEPEVEMPDTVGEEPDEPVAVAGMEGSASKGDEVSAPDTPNAPRRRVLLADIFTVISSAVSTEGATA